MALLEELAARYAGFPVMGLGAFNEPELLTLKGHTDLIYSVAFSPNGRLIATPSVDRTVRVWEAALPQQVTAWRNEENPTALHLPPVEIRPNEKAR